MFAKLPIHAPGLAALNRMAAAAIRRPPRALIADVAQIGHVTYYRPHAPATAYVADCPASLKTGFGESLPLGKPHGRFRVRDCWRVQRLST
ncbi:hypothetical protein BCEP27_20495 [Burkholderia cepacia]